MAKGQPCSARRLTIGVGLAAALAVGVLAAPGARVLALPGDGCDASETDSSFSMACEAPSVTSDLLNEQEQIDAPGPGQGAVHEGPHIPGGHG